MLAGRSGVNSRGVSCATDGVAGDVASEEIVGEVGRSAEKMWVDRWNDSIASPTSAPTSKLNVSDCGDTERRGGNARFRSSALSAVPESRTLRNQSLISDMRCFRSYIVGWAGSPAGESGRSDESKMSNS